jgi:sigma-B regulation protein RsbU (phosphoserine phosphatase)
MQIDWKQKLKRLGKVEKTFFVLLFVYLILALARPGSAVGALLAFVLFVLSIWIIGKLAIFAMRKAIWRLRNRLVATYVFIAVVPVALIVLLAGIGTYALISQLAVYLALADLDRGGATLHQIAATLAESGGPIRTDVLERVAQSHRHRFPELWVIQRTNDKIQTWPPSHDESPPPPNWKQAEGVVERNGHFFLWSHVVNAASRVTVMAPLSRAYLSRMLPGLPDVTLLEYTDDAKSKFVVSNEDGKVNHLKFTNEPAVNPIPPPYNRFDIEVGWFSTLPIWRWNSPGKRDTTLLYVHTRPSVVLGTIFNANVDTFSSGIQIALIAVSILFLIVEIGALVIGVSLARTITRAVHNLYQGTQRVTEGDFSHRIAVYGKDQLAALSTSFNAMTENLERLLVVAKEKERLQAEIEIAREVQNQLYPKVLPVLRTMTVAATCEPARMVSGDYYDYLVVPKGKLALAIGDVAGKGISAALLMATLQSAMRMELRTSSCIPTLPPVDGQVHVATAQLVSDLNQLLYATTAPEKYATFFFALYDEATSDLHYTNAGHLPPLLVRNGSAVPLDVNGTVVGAFPFSEYQESQVRMESGDLLVCYTDGITEPENEYGEMFGEERLIELVTKNADCEDSKLLAMILDAVHQWTSAAEQPDDMTLLLARKT